MNVTLLAMGVATLLGLGIVIGIGLFSLLSGAFHFLFARPRLDILKTGQGSYGFSFGFRWNAAREPAKFNLVRLRLYNPFGSPTQVDVSKEFEAAGDDFARDLDMGPGLEQLLQAKGMDESMVEVQVCALKDGITHYFKMKGKELKEKMKAATQTADEFNQKYKVEKTKPLYQTVQRTFIADPLPESNRALKIPTNPEFAGQFASAGADAGAQENFAVSKVWIEPGCIVCNACEGIYPEVFEVTDETCLIRPGAPLEDGLRILEAAEACPVEVIKFTKVS